MAFQNAVRKFRMIIGTKHPVESMTQKYLTQTLITYPEFLRIIKSNEETYKQLLPLNQNIQEFLITRFSEMLLTVSENNYESLLSFISEIHSNLRPKAEFSLYNCRLPGDMVKVRSHKNRIIEEESESLTNLGGVLLFSY